MDELYTPERFPSDEDNGEMSAWYILATLGFFPLTVGHPAYVLGAPRFPRATINLPGAPLVITAADASSDAPYVADVSFNGQPHRSLEIPHAYLASGGELAFSMTSDAKRAAARGKLKRPFSLSTHM